MASQRIPVGNLLCEYIGVIRLSTGTLTRKDHLILVEEDESSFLCYSMMTNKFANESQYIKPVVSRK
jgi:SET domain-containing protein